MKFQATEPAPSQAVHAHGDRRCCTRCLYDDQMPAIKFDMDGACSYCHSYDQLNRDYPNGSKGTQILENMAQKIRAAGRGKKYDCVVGISGGCDSSYLLYRIKEMGLCPLAVHFDNTWNSAVATTNMARVLKGLDVDLYTHVVNNKEYDDIYRSFFYAGLPDVEAPTDIGLASTLYMAAARHGIRYVIEGHSFRTEGISPLGWLYMDGRYIHSVHQAHGTMPMKTFPNLWLSSFLKWTAVNRIRKLRPLYHMDYDKEAVKKFLADRFGWQWYGGHHLENRFTAYYHRHFIPRRLGVDTRLLGHAALVRSGQLSREEGLRQLSKDSEEDPEIVELVKKRLGFNDSEHERLLNLPLHSYRDYPTYKRTFERLRPLFWFLQKFELVPRSFYMKYTARQETVS